MATDAATIFVLAASAVQEVGRSGVAAFGRWVDANLLSAPVSAAGWGGGLGPGSPGPDRVSRCVCWSGWVGDDRAEWSDPRTWSGPGWAALRTWCEGARRVGGGQRWSLRPRAGHVVSDVPSCRRFLRELAGGPVELLADPAGLLTAPMLPRAEDHAARLLDAIAGEPGLAGVLVTNVVRADQSGAGRGLAASPVHRGELEPALLSSIARRAQEAGVPVVVLDEEVEAQRAMLSG